YAGPLHYDEQPDRAGFPRRGRGPHVREEGRARVPSLGAVWRATAGPLRTTIPAGLPAQSRLGPRPARRRQPASRAAFPGGEREPRSLSRVAGSPVRRLWLPDWRVLPGGHAPAPGSRSSGPVVPAAPRVRFRGPRGAGRAGADAPALVRRRLGVGHRSRAKALGRIEQPANPAISSGVSGSPR